MAKGLIPLSLSYLRNGRLFTATAARDILEHAAFGTAPRVASLVASGVGSAALLILPAPPWTSAGNVWTLSGSTRAAVIRETAPERCAVRLQVRQTSDHVFAMVRATPDGRSGYEGGVIVVAGTPYARIRRVLEGTPITESTGNAWVTNDADGVPANGDCNVDVSTLLGASQPFMLEARIADDFIELRINDDAVPVIRHKISVTYTAASDTATFAPSFTQNFAGNLGAGWSSTVSGAKVLSAEIADLVGQVSSRADLLVAVADGAVYMVDDQKVVRRIASGVFSPTASVKCQEFAGSVYFVGDGKARVLDPVRQTVSAWTPTAGTLPGQTTAGTTSATVLGQLGTRLAVAGNTSDPQNVWFSAVADAMDFDTGGEDQGRAFTLTGTRPLKTGDPVTCLREAGNTSLMVGCAGSAHLIEGDPALGAIDTQVLLEDAGVSGTGATVRIEDGRVVMHTTKGLVVVNGSSASYLSKPVITQGIETLRPVDVLVARDPRRNLTYVILPDAVFLYDERTGQWTPGLGGFHPATFPASMKPTCAAVWLGQLVLGCADGYIRTLSDDAVTDDGTPIVSYVLAPITGAGTGGLGGDIVIRNTRVMLTRDSGPCRVLIYGARTPEDLLDGTRRKVLATMTITPYRTDPLTQAVRSPAVGVLLGPSTNAAKRWSVESLTADLDGRESRHNPE